MARSQAESWDPPTPGTKWLLRLPNWIGDAVMVLPALRSLPREEQDWTGVCHPRVRSLYHASGLFDRLLDAAGGSAPIRLRTQLRALKPERAIVFTEAISGSVLAKFSGAPLRLGWERHPNRLLLTHARPGIDRSRSLWESYLELCEFAGGQKGELNFQLPIDKEDQAKAKVWLPKSKKAIGIVPGAAYGPAKQWPLDSFRSLIQALLTAGYPVVLLGGPGEVQVAEALDRDDVTNLVGKTSLTEMVACLARCRAVVTHDSGGMHLARAAGTPMVALFGSSSPAWTGPGESEGAVLWQGLECSPCFKRECPLPEPEKHMACLKSISVDEVLSSLESVIKKKVRS
ncbi:MAG: lipopolysaccharide heptosyltransferase II [Candidatus Eisenbacteria bacterium]|uniref:lipopolysaccharide heptosyltransferase II n=1 Tax=Eiseniibacteriota bacterium TaxID=2212470 RepID=A0A7Y2E825_UNCEI|nr:lipopolysaccharide heptosyltransferase II [Candidatus Eisenbacteria bacterium]